MSSSGLWRIEPSVQDCIYHKSWKWRKIGGEAETFACHHFHPSKEGLNSAPRCGQFASTHSYKTFLINSEVDQQCISLVCKHHVAKEQVSKNVFDNVPRFWVSLSRCWNFEHNWKKKSVYIKDQASPAFFQCW